MEILLLSTAEVIQALPMDAAIAGMKTAYMQLATNIAAMPLRTHLAVPGAGTSLFMPAFLPQTNDMAVKVASVFPGNPDIGLPTIHALVLALDAATGRPLALLAGEALTAIRTGAGAGAATDVLARPNAATVAIIGSGVQARTQLEAICTVRKIREVRVYSPNRDHALAFAVEMVGRGPISAQIKVVADADTAVSDADIICTATTSDVPVFDGRNLKPGAHVNAVGSYLPTMQEVDVTTIQKALVVVDHLDSALAEAGDLIIPLQRGAIARNHIHAELGAIIAGQKTGRTNPQQITYFKSVGVAVQDAAAAGIALRNAAALNLGTKIIL